MRSMLLSTALIFTALFSSGCATLTVDHGCDGCAVDPNAVSCCDGSQVARGGGLLGRLRGRMACNSCGNGACSDCQAGPGMMAGGGMVGGGMAGDGMMAGGMMNGGRRVAGGGMLGAAGCQDGSCGLLGGGLGSGVAGRGIGARGIGGRGVLAGGFGRAGACGTCGMLGGNCRCGLLGNHAPYTPDYMGPAAGTPGGGPETAHYRYPYYTTRAPRDFLMSNPPSIGW